MAVTLSGSQPVEGEFASFNRVFIQAAFIIPGERLVRILVPFAPGQYLAVLLGKGLRKSCLRELLLHSPKVARPQRSDLV